MNIKNIDICAKCKGICCKRIPGILTPKNLIDAGIKISRNSLIKLLENNHAIDWWESENLIYFIRPATKLSKKIIDPSWGGECIFLADNGCTAKIKPQGCADLIPSHEGKCENKRNKFFYVNSWKNYQQIIVDVVNKLQHN